MSSSTIFNNGKAQPQVFCRQDTNCIPPQVRILEDIQSVRSTENYLEGRLLKNDGDCF